MTSFDPLSTFYSITSQPFTASLFHQLKEFPSSSSLPYTFTASPNIAPNSTPPKSRDAQKEATFTIPSFLKLSPGESHNRCEKSILTALETNSNIETLLTSINSLGCPFDPIDNIYCSTCDDDYFGGFSSDSANIVICENSLLFQKRVEATLIHELIHAFDHCRSHFDNSNLNHVACSEIRAAALSGDCSWSMEHSRGNIGFNLEYHYPKCVRTRAIEAVRLNPACPNEFIARTTVDQVFPKCFADTSPFPEIPWW